MDRWHDIYVNLDCIDEEKISYTCAPGIRVLPERVAHVSEDVMYILLWFMQSSMHSPRLKSYSSIVQW